MTLSPLVSQFIFWAPLVVIAIITFEVLSERRERRDVADKLMDWRALHPLDDEGEAA